jgi:hypothetical protein
MAWQEQAAASKDGFFVYSGPLVPEGEKVQVERLVSFLSKKQKASTLLINLTVRMEPLSVVEVVAAGRVVVEHWPLTLTSLLLPLCPFPRIPVCLFVDPVQEEEPLAGHEGPKRPSRAIKALLIAMALLRLRLTKVAVAVQEVLRDPAVEEVLPALVVVNPAR